jgi:hypothetical protein
MSEHQQEVSPNPAADKFYSGAERRVISLVLILGVIVGIMMAAVAGIKPLPGFAAGLVLSVVNTRWLHKTSQRAAASLAANALEGNKPWFTGMSLALGLVLRLTLVSAAGYAIFKGSREGFYGFLCGLAMPICALFAEALYESWVALRRGL